MVADQLIQWIESFHSRFYLHLDIKPDNVMISRTNKDTIYLIDYGVS